MWASRQQVGPKVRSSVIRCALLIGGMVLYRAFNKVLIKRGNGPRTKDNAACGWHPHLLSPKELGTKENFLSGH